MIIPYIILTVMLLGTLILYWSALTQFTRGKVDLGTLDLIGALLGTFATAINIRILL